MLVFVSSSLSTFILLLVGSFVREFGGPFRFIYALCYVLIAYLVISNRCDLLISGILRCSFAVVPKNISECLMMVLDAGCVSSTSRVRLPISQLS